MLAYSYPPLQAGTLLRRYKRFLADVALPDGTTITAHCPNTGPMTGVCAISAPVWVSFQPSPERKLAYTWEAIYVDGTWVGINTSVPNRAIASLIQQHGLPELGHYTTWRSEVPYGHERSRIDFCLEGGDRPVFVEVKNTTWCEGTTALFPDTVTTRGQKHLRELMAVAATGARAVLIFFIHRADCPTFAPGDRADPTYGQLLREAIAAGVEVLPYRFDPTPAGLMFCGLAELAC